MFEFKINPQQLGNEVECRAELLKGNGGLDLLINGNIIVSIKRDGRIDTNWDSVRDGLTEAGYLRPEKINI